MRLFLFLIVSTMSLSLHAEVLTLKCEYDPCVMSKREIRELSPTYPRHQCQQQQTSTPQYGSQRAFELTVRGEIDGTVTLTNLIGSNYSAQPPYIYSCANESGQCQISQQPQYPQEQIITEHNDKNFKNIIEVEKYILREFCTGEWSSGLKYLK